MYCGYFTTLIYRLFPTHTHNLISGIEIDTQTLLSPITTAPPATTQPDVSCPPAADGITNTQDTVNILVIALPIALATVLIVMMITLAGVIVCVKFSGREKQNKE